MWADRGLAPPPSGLPALVTGDCAETVHLMFVICPAACTTRLDPPLTSDGQESVQSRGQPSSAHHLLRATFCATLSPASLGTSRLHGLPADRGGGESSAGSRPAGSGRPPTRHSPLGAAAVHRRACTGCAVSVVAAVSGDSGLPGVACAGAGDTAALWAGPPSGSHSEPVSACQAALYRSQDDEAEAAGAEQRAAVPCSVRGLVIRPAPRHGMCRQRALFTSGPLQRTSRGHRHSCLGTIFIPM